MECLLQYLDDLDDVYGMIGLVAERARRLLLTLFRYFAVAIGAVAGMGLALIHQPLALATSILLCMSLLYRRVTTHFANALQTA